MDKGFNDDELADIMSEIETLEQEFQEEVKPEATNSVETQSEVEEPAAEHEVEEPVAEQEVEAESQVLEQVTKLPEHEATPSVEAHDDNVHQLRPVTSAGHGAETSMSFKVEGDMTLDLTFNISGKEVHLNVNDQGLEIGLGDGAKFTLPLDQTHKNKKVA